MRGPQPDADDDDSVCSFLGGVVPFFFSIFSWSDVDDSVCVCVCVCVCVVCCGVVVGGCLCVLMPLCVRLCPYATICVS